jgi:AmiR/NasT family two-component response regulator
VDFLSRAAERGISAYVESMDPESVQGAIEVAVRRYREASRLHEKVEQLEGALDRRGVIERAKGILMERHGCDERQAFDLLRDHSRSTGRRVVDVAQAVLDGHSLLPRDR